MLVFYFLFWILGGLLFNFHKKLIFLMLLESSMIFTIFFYLLFLGEVSLFFLFYLMIFMVMDSVLGLSCLILEGRNSSFFTSFLYEN